MFEKIKYALQNANYGKAAIWAALWIGLVTLVLYVFRANDYIGHTDSGNIIFYPSYFKCVVLFFTLAPGWSIVSLILSYIGGLTIEILRDILADAETGTIIIGIGLPFVFSLLVPDIGITNRNIDEITHHTITQEEYKALPKKKHVDYFFTDAFQADSLYGK